MVISILIILFLLGFVMLAVLTFARDLLASILSWIMGIFKRKSKDSPQPGSPRQTIRRRQSKKSKVVDENDGEYVDFEEIKK